jgi:hypothetical protein
VKLKLSYAPWVVALFVACSSSSGEDGPAPQERCEGNLETSRFPGGGEGHADPFGAKASGQARAGRVRDASQVVLPANGRVRPRVGDFVLANDKIAVYVAGRDRADGYIPFGGKVLAIEPVGDDGRPKGASQYGESLFLYGLQTVLPETVSVINDGSDGKAAIVRASGVLENVPFTDIFSALLPEKYGFPVAYDYVLEPGAEKLSVRVTMTNTRTEAVDLTTSQNFGFFHDYRSATFTAEHGFDTASGDSAFVANDGADAAFLFRVPGKTIEAGISVSGFQLFRVKGGSLDACQTKTFDFVDIVSGAPGIDGVLEASRRAYGEPAWREVRGQVTESDGGPPVAGALVHATAPDGRYLTRARTDTSGAFVLHVPAGAAALVPTARGFALPAPTPLGEGDASVTLTVPRQATLVVTAKDALSGEVLPARVQVVPEASFAAAPKEFGAPDEARGRLHQAFTTTGSVELLVPPGQHRVIVTRGYEYEVYDQPITVTAGETTPVEASLARSVDSTGVMCADFHIHSFFSVDSHDTVVEKVKSAVADGLDIPVSSEHDWIVDFQPIITQLGLQKWAFGFASEELTTFTYGHFGVIPIVPRPEQVNMGAVDWTRKSPAQLFSDVAALPEQPILIVNHPSGGSFAGYFSQSVLDRATGKGTPDLWSEAFHGIEVFNASDFESNREGSVADWFALLNAGKAFFAVGSSDSHHIRTAPVGYPRTCMRLGHDDPAQVSASGVRDILRSGAATISGGLLMEVVGPGGIGPGGTATAGEYQVTVRSPSWIEASTLEVIVDGATTQMIDLTAASAGAGKLYEAKVSVTGTASRPRHWVVFHARGPAGKDLAPLHPGDRPFAVSNPIWF